ncbi:uncharacterized protein METZ01_LOCUS218547, partial [marine metagenome]
MQIPIQRRVLKFVWDLRRRFIDSRGPLIYWDLVMVASSPLGGRQ